MTTYEKAELEIVELKSTDLITTSSGNNIGKDNDENDTDWIDKK